jgi:hypothetical protein
MAAPISRTTARRAATGIADAAQDPLPAAGDLMAVATNVGSTANGGGVVESHKPARRCPTHRLAGTHPGIRGRPRPGV